MSYKWMREKMVKIYGELDMIEEAGIRYISQVIRQSMPGYKEIDDRIEYHHIIPVKEGGPTTIANGALLRGYNHKWLESLPRREREDINIELQKYKAYLNWKIAEKKAKEFKLGFMDIVNLEPVKGKILEIDMSDFIEIPLIPNREKEEMER